MHSPAVEAIAGDFPGDAGACGGGRRERPGLRRPRGFRRSGKEFPRAAAGNSGHVPEAGPDGREQVQTAKLAVQFFRIGDGVYADAILKEMPDSKLEKSIAALMLFPVHALAKVEFHGDTLQLRYPSPDLGKALRDKKLPPVMTFTTFDEEIEDDDGVAVFTATGEAWEDVLQNMPETVFGDSDKEVVTFKRVVVK